MYDGFRSDRIERDKGEHKSYYWLILRDKGGKAYLVGPYDSEEEARAKGLSDGVVDFDIKSYPTRSVSRATQMFKGMRLNRGENVDSVTKRVGHKKSLRRYRNKRDEGSGFGW